MESRLLAANKNLPQSDRLAVLFARQILELQSNPCLQQLLSFAQERFNIVVLLNSCDSRCFAVREGLYIRFLEKLGCVAVLLVGFREVRKTD
jgi:hypothetical protein